MNPTAVTANGSLEPIAILGVSFDNVTLQTALDRIEGMIASGRPHYMVTANVDFLVQARTDVELRRILLESHLVLCDGTPVLWASRLLGNPLPERVAGADLVPRLIQRAASKGYRLFFLGATPASCESAVARMRDAYPDLIIAGHYSPPFNRLLEMDHERNPPADNTGPAGPVVGFIRLPQAGEVDSHALPEPGCAGLGRGGSHHRFPGRDRQARAGLDAAYRDGVDVSSGAGAPAAGRKVRQRSVGLRLVNSSAGLVFAAAKQTKGHDCKIPL